MNSEGAFNPYLIDNGTGSVKSKIYFWTNIKVVSDTTEAM